MSYSTGQWSIKGSQFRRRRSGRRYRACLLYVAVSDDHGVSVVLRRFKRHSKDIHLHTFEGFNYCKKLNLMIMVICLYLPSAILATVEFAIHICSHVMSVRLPSQRIVYAKMARV